MALLAAHSTDQSVHRGKQLRHVEIGLRKVNKAIEALAPKPGLDNCLLQQFKERITSLKAELEDIAQAALLLEDEGPLKQHTMLKQALYDLDLKVKQLLHACKSSLPTPENTTRVKLLNIDVPTFDGNILNWNTFWEQFEVAIHSKTQLTKAEKLAYLRNALNKLSKDWHNQLINMTKSIDASRSVIIDHASYTMNTQGLSSMPLL